MENSFYVQRVFSSFTNRSCQKNTSSARFCSRAFTGGSPRTYLIQVSSSGKGTSSHQICQTSAALPNFSASVSGLGGLVGHLSYGHIRPKHTWEETNSLVNQYVCFIPIQKRENLLAFCGTETMWLVPMCLQTAWSSSSDFQDKGPMVANMQILPCFSSTALRRSKSSLVQSPPQ